MAAPDTSDNSVAAIFNANEIVVRVLVARSTAPYETQQNRQQLRRFA